MPMELLNMQHIHTNYVALLALLLTVVDGSLEAKGLDLPG